MATIGASIELGWRFVPSSSLEQPPPRFFISAFGAFDFYCGKSLDLFIFLGNYLDGLLWRFCLLFHDLGNGLFVFKDETAIVAYKNYCCLASMSLGFRPQL